MTSDNQRPSSPERAGVSDLHEAQQGCALDLITSTSPNKQDGEGLEVTTENLTNTSVPEVQDTNSEPFTSARIVGVATS